MPTLSTRAEEAAVDLDRLVGALGTAGLGRQDFTDLLMNVLPPNDEADADAVAGRLFDELIQMCKEAEVICCFTADDRDDAECAALPPSPALERGELDGSALRLLYAYHPSYTTCRNPMDTALALTDHVKVLFQSALGDASTKSPRGVVQTHDGRRRSSLDRRGVGNLVKMLSSKSLLVPADEPEEEKKEANDDLSDEEEDVKPIVDEFMLANDQAQHPQDDLDETPSNGHSSGNRDATVEELGLEVVASSLLRYKKESTSEGPSIVDPKTLLGGSISDNMFDPLHTSSDDFIAALDDAVLNHDALNHHVLTSFSMGSWGGLPGTLSNLANFMLAYRSFTSTFCTHLISTTKLVAAEDPSGHHAEVLEENLEEEQGIYDDETIGMIKHLGLDPSLLCNVPHKDLYVTCCERLQELSNTVEGALVDRPVLTNQQCEYIAAPLVEAFSSACDPAKGATADTAIAAMYSGSELLVATFYSKLSAYLRVMAEKNPNGPVCKQDLAFFLLHIDMDVEHADHMRAVVVDFASTEGKRLRIAKAVDAILKARVELLDRFVEAVFPPTGHSAVDSAQLYNKQSNNWVRKGATCLSDFTGRPVVFDMCSSFVRDAHVLDVGCGEGYGARKLVEMGAKRIVGLDVSSAMIEKANANPVKSSRETYVTCDADKIIESFNDMPAELGLVPGRMLEEGSFDMAIAIFLFNYTSISKMKAICDQIYLSLKPGGHFVFSVPHPFMLNAHGSEETSNDTFSFSKGDAKADSYFSLRDRKFAGVIRTLDGRELNVKMLFKTVSDYIDTLGAVGFDMAKMHEARVLPEHVAAHPNFFESVRDSPLHIVFDVVKPVSSAVTGRIPKAIRWSSYEKSLATKTLPIAMPDQVSSELIKHTIAIYDGGITEDSWTPSVEDARRLTLVAKFAAKVRARLTRQVGAVHITGMDMVTLGRDTTEAGAAGRAKLAYYILSSLIGKVDGSARGRLFDVVDRGLDTNADNVLFSVSRAEAPWHTDGASADKAYDGVGLLCLNPAAQGGTLHLSNAVTALDSLKSKLPKFIMNELFRPLPRDILENGSGQGVGNGLVGLARNPDLLKLRILHNAFPIFEEGDQQHVRFRYMRQWVESGHEKGGIQLSPLLTIAMDALDSALSGEKVASVKLDSGDIVYCNNMNFAHARDAFENGRGEKPRHQVRVWFRL